MKTQAILPPVPLAAAIGFPGAAVAQNALNGVEIPADQLQVFQDKRHRLRASGTASLSTDESDKSVDATETGSIASGEGASSGIAGETDWTKALASLTVEQCDEAGLKAAM